MQETKNRISEQLAGCQQIIQLDQAVMAAILEQTGAVTVRQEDIRRILRENRQVRAEFRGEEGSYRLWTEGGEKV